MNRFGSVTWSGGLREGKWFGLDRKPRVGEDPSLHALQPLPYQSRGDAWSTHAACSTVSFVRLHSGCKTSFLSNSTLNLKSSSTRTDDEFSITSVTTGKIYPIGKSQHRGIA